MNAKQLSQRLQVSESTVSRIASGQRKPGLSLILRIRGVLQWPVDQQVILLNLEPEEYGRQFTDRMRRTSSRKRRSDPAAPAGSSSVRNPDAPIGVPDPKSPSAPSGVGRGQPTKSSGRGLTCLRPIE